MLRTPDVLKNFSMTLAEMMSAADGRADFKRVYEEYLTSSQMQTQPAQTPDNNPKNVTEGKPDLDPIGIWEPIWENGEVWFVRPDGADPWHLWADVERIPPKGTKSRVILLGESVARGYPLDPYCNVAMALRTLLEFSGNEDIEIVDLARNGKTFRGLEEMFEPSLALKPDAYIVFAGNNWHRPEQMGNFEEALAFCREAESWTSIKEYIEATVTNQVRAFVERLGAFSARNCVPIIFIIPDFNLQDWRLDFSSQSPFATGDLIRQRLTLIAAAEAALATDNLQQAAVLATELIEMEEGSHPAGFELLAKCKLKQGHFNEARRLKENAKDLVIIHLHLQIPTCPVVTQNILRKDGPSNGIIIIDLPDRIAEYLPQQLPDRRLFLDHVHMTVEGIRLAAASAVEKLLPLLGKKERSWQELNQCELSVEPRVMAMVHFRAACAANGSGQNAELSYFHCAEAIRHDPQISEAMQIFINWQVRPYHLKYIKQLEDAAGLEKSLRPSFFNHLGHAKDQPLHVSLIESMAASLSDSVPGIREKVNLLVHEAHAITPEGVDLLQGAYTDLRRSPLELQWRRDNGYFRSYRQESFFQLVCDSACELQIVLTYRLFKPDAAERTIQLLVNGVVAADLVASTHWQVWQGTISPELFNRGVNSIIVRWPEPPTQTSTERAKELIQNLESVRLWQDVKDVYSVYGEIHEFRAQPA